MIILSGTANATLSEMVAKNLKRQLGDADVRRFTDNEIYVEVKDNVRGEDVFVIQPTSCPANDHIMELLIVLDALRRGSAKRITAVIPYFGYARQDRKTTARSPISAKLVANILTAAGADRILTFDLHTAQIQGFFDIPLDNLSVAPVFSKYMRDDFDLKNTVVVSPDIGGVGRARGFAKRIDCPIAIIDKRRNAPGESEVMHVVGEVKGKTCVLYDDMIDSGGTIINAAEALIEEGATSVMAMAAHGVFSHPESISRLESSKIEEIIISDSILMPELIKRSSKFKVLSIAPLISQAIERINLEKSVSSLFDE